MPGGGFSRGSTVQDDVRPQGFTLGDFCIDEYRPIKVIVIGAGFSGITAGVRFPQKIPNVELTIYEKSAGVGGTWFNNKYPGLACDIPAHCYQLTFAEKNDWSAFYAPGPEIRDYLQGVVDKYKLMRYINLQHEVVHAQYDAPAGKWRVRVRRPNHSGTGEPEEFEDSADVVMTAFGSLSRWKWPDIEGLHDFKGELHHSAGFDPSDKTWQEVAEAWADKKVGVIGVGSSALQLVPALQPRVSKLVNYVRGKTWLAVPFASNAFAELLGRDPATAEDYKFTPEERERFKNDPEFYRNFRLALETEINSVHSSTLRGTPMQMHAQAAFRANMEKKLAKKPWIAEKLIPEFPVACRRLTPGPGYLEALCEENVDFVSTPIKRVTERGIETVDGEHQELDVLFCATGYDTTFQLPFSIIGRDGVELNARWRPHPVSYLSVAVDGFPNLFMALGPNSGVGSGSLLALIEYQVAYAVQATAKLQRERLKSIEVKPEALRDFDEYLEAYFQTTVYSEKCRSWYKMGKEEGRVVGLWPGSTLHALKALSHPRWEDYNYERADPEVGNRMYWLGDGQTHSEKTLTGDRAWYLREPFLDIPPGKCMPSA
ncbi:FAD/NAD-P-binding domain-containing protein [Trametes polyzona]|nr:FAD/NAD-P-binding domain-containing protein [Trametes polyzona]